jgi:folate-binding protein YgfZ
MTPGYEALRNGAAWMNLSARARIEAWGRDRARFLHNVTSNEVKKMAPGAGAYAFVLTPQGRIQADVCLFAFADHFLIDTEPELREKVPQLILRYKVADQVELKDVTGETAAIGLEGPASAAVLATLSAPVPPAGYAHLPWNDSTIADVTITGQPGFRIFCPLGQVTALTGRIEAAGAVAATAEDARVVRIENGRPLFGVDIRETSLPQETQQMHAVSFTKGCYLGQEIVERIRAQGQVNKLLSHLEIDAPEAVPAGTRLIAGDADVGEVTSSVYSPQYGKVVGLGYVRRQHAAAGTALRAGDFQARVI